MNNEQDSEKKTFFTHEQYELHVQQLENIKKEIEEQDQEIITEKLDLQLLEVEYHDNQGFLIKIQNIRNKFPMFRRVRRDGSCFYRGLLFKIFEQIVLKKDQNLHKIFKDTINNSKNDLKAIGYDELVIDDFQQLMLEKLDLFPQKLTQQEVKKIFCDKMQSDYLIMYMRMMTSGFIKTNSFMFEGYIETETVDQFCQQEVDPIDREADQIQIMAIINYINIPVKIYYLDGNVNNLEATVFKIPEDATDDSIFVNLLYRPGHYDILYQN